MSKAVIVIPCFNEVRRLREEFLADLLKHSETALVLVDDGSTDGTADWLNAWAKRQNGRAEVLVLESRQGKGEAIRRGMISCVRQGPEVVGYVDADGATPAEECRRLLEEFLASPEKKIALFGSRIRRLGVTISRRPARHYLGRLFATFASYILDLPVYDTQCGTKFFRWSPVVQACLSTPFQSRWFFDVELIGRLAIRVRAAGGDPGMALMECPLRVWHDTPGSHRTLGVYLRAITDLWRVKTALERWRRDEGGAQATRLFGRKE